MSRILAMALIVLAGCTRETQVNGDVFVVTKGRENIKLALVAVAFVPESDMASYVSERIAAVKQELAANGPPVEQAKKELKAAEDAVQEFLAEERKQSAVYQSMAKKAKTESSKTIGDTEKFRGTEALGRGFFVPRTCGYASRV